MRSSVRSRLAPPAFARAASEGCRAEALLAKAGWWPRARAWRARSPLGEGGLVAASYGLASLPTAIVAIAWKHRIPARRPSASARFDIVKEGSARSPLGVRGRIQRRHHCL